MKIDKYRHCVYDTPNTMCREFWTNGVLSYSIRGHMYDAKWISISILPYNAIPFTPGSIVFGDKLALSEDIQI